MANNHYQAGLFRKQTHVIDLDGLEAHYWPEFISRKRADEVFERLLLDTPWRQETITVYGKAHLTPRLSHWVGDAGLSYTYSNHTMQAAPWSELLIQLKAEVEAACAASFNSVLLNYYRDGQDSNGWHSDDEPELGPEPLIASLSLGAARDFQLRLKRDKAHKLQLNLQSGSLLVMQRGVQQHWQHQVPKRANAQARINLTFRQVQRTA